MELYLIMFWSSYLFCRRFVLGGGEFGAASAVTETAAVGAAPYGLTTFVGLWLNARHTGPWKPRRDRGGVTDDPLA
jgi:hypothetical protein